MNPEFKPKAQIVEIDPQQKIFRANIDRWVKDEISYKELVASLPSDRLSLRTEAIIFLNRILPIRK